MGMNSNIFKRKDGTYTMKEFEQGVDSKGIKKRIQNVSVIPPKYSPTDKFQGLRKQAKNNNDEDD